MGKINLNINPGCSEGALNSFIRSQTIELFVDEKYQGRIPLYEIISSNGRLISVSISEQKHKKDILKGHYFMKLLNE